MSASEQEIISDPKLAMRSYIQRVATGPEYSKDISFAEARDAMTHILNTSADPVQAGIFLIALRMKRETLDENGGCLQAIIDASNMVAADVDHIIDVADPYDGYTRGTPVSPFIPAVLAACGLPAVSHGAEAVGPKYGATHRKVLRAAGIDVDCDMQQALTQINNPESAWAYIDQKTICPSLHNLIPLRTQIVKRPVITTVEVLIGPVRGKKSTTLMTGYVHKPYPPVYTHLARISGFDSAVLVRGVEGGVIPSLKQESKYFEYKGTNDLTEVEIYPEHLNIQQDVRAVPLPELNAAKSTGDNTAAKIDTDQLAEEAAKIGVAALQGEHGPARDSLIYSTAIMLTHMGVEKTIQASAEKVRTTIDSGKAFAHFQKNQLH
ncbi:MAG: anthranilate phosphoribosyltransferase [Gammaproteobacteria bacterium]|nr:MAG: anthranilate phosphoribosyltransferase [Gammaproteobacteria bacterium]